MTVAAENDFYVRGNITYTTDPRVYPKSTDALALLTLDDINVDTTAPNNLEIDAAMMCTGTSGDGSAGSFGVVNYSSGSPRGDFTVLGGIVQNTRGAVGTFNSSSGQLQRLHQELQLQRPLCQHTAAVLSGHQGPGAILQLAGGTAALMALLASLDSTTKRWLLVLVVTVVFAVATVTHSMLKVFFPVEQAGAGSQQPPAAAAVVVPVNESQAASMTSFAGQSPTDTGREPTPRDG